MSTYLNTDLEVRGMSLPRMDLPGPSRRIIVEPLRKPQTKPATTEPSPEKAPAPTPEREQVPA